MPEAPDGRSESEEERADRQWQELIQEIRVAQTGVQILFGFLLTVVFTPSSTHFRRPTRPSTSSPSCSAPWRPARSSGPSPSTASSRAGCIKREAVAWASRLTFTGLVLLLATCTSALFLVLRVATHDALVPWLVAGVLAWYLLCWFVLPLWARIRYTAEH